MRSSLFTASAGYVGACFAVLVLVVASTFVGVADISLDDLIQNSNDKALLVFEAARIPRTIALCLAGAGLAMAGTVMQLMSQNRFADPSTAGTVEATGLGLITVSLTAPNLPVFGKMLIAALFAAAGTGLFLLLVSRTPNRSRALIPIIGIMLGAIINAVTVFLAYRFDMLQSIAAWTVGDFSTVIRGRYELLWLCLAVTAVTYIFADRFTIMGMGNSNATNLGINRRAVLWVGVGIVSAMTTFIVVTAGLVPYVGLIVPNVAVMVFGDRLHRALPAIALCGCGVVLTCDIVGRLVIAPFEVPAGAILGVLGSAFFLFLVLRGRNDSV